MGHSQGGGLFGAMFGLGFMAISAVFVLIVVIANWKIFEKAGQPGWASIIPFYNLWVMCEIVGLPGYAMFACLVPLLNFVFGIFILLRFAKVFGQSLMFAIGLVVPFLNLALLLNLGFGDARYLGPEAANS
jgi:hypothetical protein